MAPTALLGTSVGSGAVLIAITLIVFPIAAISFARSGQAWRSIGRGPFAIDPDLPPRSVPRMPSPVSLDTKETEVRQMVEAKAYHRRRRGQPPVDVDAEVQRRVADLIGLAD